MYRVDRSKQLNLAEKGSIIALTHAGLSMRQIARQLGCGVATVALWQNRFEETEDVKRKEGSGRPRKTTPEQDLLMREAVRNKPITTAREIGGQEINIFLCDKIN